MKVNKIYQGDSLEILKTLYDESIDCVITSPPYWGLRDYESDGQIGLEKTPEEYVSNMVEVFREAKRALKKEGTLWLNLGDSYASKGREGGDIDKDNGMDIERGRGKLNNHPTIKPKDLVGIPWRVAFALQADGWYLRQDIIWAKPNPMPESVQDRCTKSHEYIFLLTKSPTYYFDNEAIKETATGFDGRKDTIMKGSPKYANGFVPGQPAQTVAVKGHERWKKRKNDGTTNGGNGAGFQNHSGYNNLENPYVRNKRSVWTVTTKPFKEAHFATFPEALIEPMIKAGCPKEVCKKCGKARERITEMGKIVSQGGSDTGKLAQNKETINFKGGDISAHKFIQREHKTTGYTDCSCNAGFTGGVVLDPFMGAGTTAVVARKLGRNYIGIELNEEYIKIAERRLAQQTIF